MNIRAKGEINDIKRRVPQWFLSGSLPICSKIFILVKMVDGEGSQERRTPCTTPFDVGFYREPIRVSLVGPPTPSDQSVV